MGGELHLRLMRRWMLGTTFYHSRLHLRLRLPSASLKDAREFAEMEKRVRKNLLRMSIVGSIRVSDLSPEETHYESLHLVPSNHNTQGWRTSLRSTRKALVILGSW